MEYVGSIAIAITEQPTVSPGRNAPLLWRLAGAPFQYPVRWSYINHVCPPDRNCSSTSGQVDDETDHDQRIQAGVFCHEGLSRHYGYEYELWVNDRPGTEHRVSTRVSWVCAPSADPDAPPPSEPPSSPATIVGDWIEPYQGSFDIFASSSGGWWGMLNSTTTWNSKCSGEHVWTITNRVSDTLYEGTHRFYGPDCDGTTTTAATWRLHDGDQRMEWCYLTSDGERCRTLNRSTT